MANNSELLGAIIAIRSPFFISFCLKKDAQRKIRLLKHCVRPAIPRNGRLQVRSD